MNFHHHLLKKLEKQQNICLHKWLGLHRSLTDIALYSKDVPCPLPFESLVELFKKTKFGSPEQLTNSTDFQVAECAREQRTGKWSTTKTLQNAEYRLPKKNCGCR